MARYVDILVNEPPGPHPCFIEVDDALRYRIDVRDWKKRDDGLWAVRVTIGEGMEAQPPDPADNALAGRTRPTG
jgi:hypothetical protein